LLGDFFRLRTRLTAGHKSDTFDLITLCIHCIRILPWTACAVERLGRNTVVRKCL